MVVETATVSPSRALVSLTSQPATENKEIYIYMYASRYNYNVHVSLLNTGTDLPKLYYQRLK